MQSTALCGSDDTFGLDPQSGWALSRCTEDLATIAIESVFLAAFARRVVVCWSVRQERRSPSIYARDRLDSDEPGEIDGLLSHNSGLDRDEALISSLAADRGADAVERLRTLADVDIFRHHESTALRKVAYVLAGLVFALRCSNAWLVLLSRPVTPPSLRIVIAAILEPLAWLGCLATARTESARCQPRSSLVVAFWAISTFVPASTLLRSLSQRDDGSGANGTPAKSWIAEQTHATIGLLVCLALTCVGVATVSQQNCSTVWQAYQGAWSLQREGNGDGALDRLMGLPDNKETPDHDDDHYGHSGCQCSQNSGAHSPSARTKIRRLLRLGKPDAIYIWLGISGFVLHASSKVWYQLLWGRLINAVYLSNRSGVVANSWQILLASMMAVWFDQYASIFLSIGGARLSTRLQRHVFNLIMEQDAAFFDRVKTGSLMTILSTNVGSIQNVLVHQTADLAEGLAVTIILLLYMLVREWRLTLLLVASTVVPMGVNAVIGYIAEKKTEILMVQQAAQSTVAEEQIGEVRTVKSLGHEDYAKELYRHRADATFKTRVHLAVVLAPLEGIVDTLFDGSLVLCFFIGALYTLDGSIEPEFLVSFSLLARNLRDNLGKCFRMVPEFAGAVGAAARIFELVDHRSSVNYCGGIILPSIRGELAFTNVHFCYETRPCHTVIQGLDLRIGPSQTVALVGTSGHGKSTIIDLIQRMYDPSAPNALGDTKDVGSTGGMISLDGHDLRSLEPRWLRQQLGVVRQEPALFASSVRDNVCYGLEQGTISTAQIETALRDANALDFVCQLPEGMNTQLGEKGVTLSGGQKQRIGIARALLRNPSILLLDEATSALDTESEQVVQAALANCMDGRTTVVVAHRLSTIEEADLIVVLHKGTVLEMGTHSELLQNGGRYAELATKQSLDRTQAVGAQ